MAREKNPQHPAFIIERWSGAAGDAADLIRDAAKGFIRRRVSVDALNNDPVQLTDKQKELGYKFEVVPLEKQLKYAEMILTKLVPDEKDGGIVAKLAEMSFEKMQEMVLTDGITPTLDSWDKFKQYLAFGADYSNVDPESPEVKKN